MGTNDTPSPMPDDDRRQEEEAQESKKGATSPRPDPKKIKQQHRMWRVALWGVALAVLFATAFAGAYTVTRVLDDEREAAERPPLRVGLLMAFTGGSSAMGYGTSKGIQLAQKDLEADNIEVIQVDSQCDPKVAQEAMQSLIDQNVEVVIGDGCSSASVAVLPMANNAEIPLVSPSASTPALSIPDDYFFRVIPSDHYQGPFMAEAMHEAGHRRVVVFYTNEPYGSGINGEFRERFEALGGEVVATASAEPDVIELQDHMQELATTDADALFVAPNSVVTGTSALQSARDVGMDIPFYGADIFYDTTIIANAPEATEGLVLTTFSTGTDAFKESLLAEYKIQEQLYAAAQAYDAFETIYRARDAGARIGSEFQEIIPTIEFSGVSTDIRFNEDGEIPGDEYEYDLLEVQNGEFIIRDANDAER